MAYKFKSPIIEGHVDRELLDLYESINGESVEEALIEYLYAREQVKYEKISDTFPAEFYPKYKYSAYRLSNRSLKVKERIDFNTHDRLLALLGANREAMAAVLTEALIFRLMKSF